MKKSPVLSIIILNYNAKKYLSNCLSSINQSQLESEVEVIIVDNNSSDDSIQDCKLVEITNPKLTTKYLLLKTNLGFSHGNNQGVKIITPTSKYILFLNPDTTLEANTLQGMIDYFQKHQEVDAATCNLILVATNKTQPESHRGFPTPINSFWHFFGFGIPKLFPKSKFFNGYFHGELDFNYPQVIDACVGAFLMVKKEVGEAIGWWNEKYFMYGEDLDFGYQIKKLGYKLFFIPYFKAYHYQGISSGIKKKLTTANRDTKVRSAKATTNAMRIFYQENLYASYSPLVRLIVKQGINILELYRVLKAKYL